MIVCRYRHCKKIYYSAAPMPEPLLRRAIAAFGPIFGQIYGMTESGGPGCTLHAHQHVLDGPPECDAPIAFRRPADDQLRGPHHGPGRSFLSAGCASGKSSIRSEALMAGYWNNHAATVDTILTAGCAPEISARPTSKASCTSSIESRT